MRNRLPAWFRQRLPSPEALQFSETLKEKFSLNTVCHSAKCPNRSDCFAKKHVTFLILGNRCTRNCSFCNIEHFREEDKVLCIDSGEPNRIVQAVKYFNLEYVVITSVTRDDLSDGGARHFAQVINLIKKSNFHVKVEVLIPDFMGSQNALGEVLRQEPDVIAHNLETVRRIYPLVRDRADYDRSLGVLRNAKLINQDQTTKSSILLGLGEDDSDLRQALQDLRNVKCDILVLGQYLRPSIKQYPVQKFYPPEEFKVWEEFAYQLGFKSVCSLPLARTSYLAREQEKCMTS